MAKQNKSTGLPVSVITLNCQGFRDAAKRSVLISWLHCFKPDLVCLQETHSTSSQEFSAWIFAETLNGNNPVGYTCLSSPGSNRSRGVAVLYKPTFTILDHLPDECGRSQIIHLSLFAVKFQLVNIYGPNKKNDGSEFFASLLPQLDASLPTVLCGDFNTVVDPYRDRRNCIPSSSWAYNWPQSLDTLINAMDLHDV